MEEFKTEAKLMGCQFQFGISLNDENKANELLQAGIRQIKFLEQLLSEFLPNSETSKINQSAATSKVKVHPICFELLQRSLAISKLTHGAFDISVGALKQLYDFKNNEFEMPEKQIIKKTLEKVGYRKIKLNEMENSIELENEDLKISFAAIGKGFASDYVKEMWQAAGVQSGFINASGDLNTFGKKSDGTNWKVGIAHPDFPDKNILYLPVENSSVATSGDYEQFFFYEGKRYSHNINPYTGYPLTGIKSVTVCSPSAELSDALATALYVKGIAKGIDFVNQLPATHALIIDDKNHLHFSKNLTYETL